VGPLSTRFIRRKCYRCAGAWDHSLNTPRCTCRGIIHCPLFPSACMSPSLPLRPFYCSSSLIVSFSTAAAPRSRFLSRASFPHPSSRLARNPQGRAEQLSPSFHPLSLLSFALLLPAIDARRWWRSHLRPRPRAGLAVGAPSGLLVIIFVVYMCLLCIAKGRNFFGIDERLTIDGAACTRGYTTTSTNRYTCLITAALNYSKSIFLRREFERQLSRRVTFQS